MKTSTTTSDWVFSNFQSFEASLNGGKKLPFHEVRKDAYQAFNTLGWPSPSLEEWKYTDLQEIARTPFVTAEGGGTFSLERLKEILKGELPPSRVVFVNGQWVAGLSALPSLSGCEVLSLGEILAGHGNANETVSKYLARLAVYQEHSFVALNTAFAKDGAAILLKKNTVLSEPLSLIFVSVAPQGKSTVVYPRVLVVAEEGAQAQIVEYHLGTGKYLSVPVTEIEAAPRSSISHVKIQDESLEAYHVGTVETSIKAQAQVKSLTINFGSKIARNEINPTLRGERGHCVMNGLSVGRGEQHIDNHTKLDHAVPNCESTELFKGIYDDNSSGAFCGTIIVRKDAQKTNAYQRNQAVLLSETASIETRPQLKIWADDVKCTHGATIGKLDESSLFYLRSRGIDKKTAELMLVQAFAKSVVDDLPGEQLKKWALARIEEILK